MYKQFKMEHLTPEEAEAKKEEVLEVVKDLRHETLVNLVDTDTFWNEETWKREVREQMVHVFVPLYYEDEIPIIEKLSDLLEVP